MLRSIKNNLADLSERMENLVIDLRSIYCRLCLQRASIPCEFLDRIVDSLTVQDVIESVLGISIAADVTSMHPTIVCHKCVQKLMFTLNFRQNCLLAENRLSETLEEVSSIEVNTLVSSSEADALDDNYVDVLQKIAPGVKSAMNSSLETESSSSIGNISSEEIETTAVAELDPVSENVDPHLTDAAKEDDTNKQIAYPSAIDTLENFITSGADNYGSWNDGDLSIVEFVELQSVQDYTGPIVDVLGNISNTSLAIKNGQSIESEVQMNEGEIPQQDEQRLIEMSESECMDEDKQHPGNNGQHEIGKEHEQHRKYDGVAGNENTCKNEKMQNEEPSPVYESSADPNPEQDEQHLTEISESECMNEDKQHPENNDQYDMENENERHREYDGVAGDENTCENEEMENEELSSVYESSADPNPQQDEQRLTEISESECMGEDKQTSGNNGQYEMGSEHEQHQEYDGVLENENTCENEELSPVYESSADPNQQQDEQRLNEISESECMDEDKQPSENNGHYEMENEQHGEYDGVLENENTCENEEMENEELSPVYESSADPNPEQDEQHLIVISDSECMDEDKQPSENNGQYEIGKEHEQHREYDEVSDNENTCENEEMENEQHSHVHESSAEPDLEELQTNNDKISTPNHKLNNGQKVYTLSPTDTEEIIVLYGDDHPHCQNGNTKDSDDEDSQEEQIRYTSEQHLDAMCRISTENVIVLYHEEPNQSQNEEATDPDVGEGHEESRKSQNGKISDEDQLHEALCPKDPLEVTLQDRESSQLEQNGDTSDTLDKLWPKIVNKVIVEQHGNPRQNDTTYQALNDDSNDPLQDADGDTGEITVPDSEEPNQNQNAETTGQDVEDQAQRDDAKDGLLSALCLREIGKNTVRNEIKFAQNEESKSRVHGHSQHTPIDDANRLLQGTLCQTNTGEIADNEDSKQTQNDDNDLLQHGLLQKEAKLNPLQDPIESNPIQNEETTAKDHKSSHQSQHDVVNDGLQGPLCQKNTGKIAVQNHKERIESQNDEVITQEHENSYHVQNDDADDLLQDPLCEKKTSEIAVQDHEELNQIQNEEITVQEDENPYHVQNDDADELLQDPLCEKDTGEIAVQDHEEHNQTQNDDITTQEYENSYHVQNDDADDLLQDPLCEKDTGEIAVQDHEELNQIQNEETTVPDNENSYHVQNDDADEVLQDPLCEKDTGEIAMQDHEELNQIQNEETTVQDPENSHQAQPEDAHDQPQHKLCSKDTGEIAVQDREESWLMHQGGTEEQLHGSVCRGVKSEPLVIEIDPLYLNTTLDEQSDEQNCKELHKPAKREPLGLEYDKYRQVAHMQEKVCVTVNGEIAKQVAKNSGSVGRRKGKDNSTTQQRSGLSRPGPKKVKCSNHEDRPDRANAEVKVEKNDVTSMVDHIESQRQRAVGTDESQIQSLNPDCASTSNEAALECEKVSKNVRKRKLSTDSESSEAQMSPPLVQKKKVRFASEITVLHGNMKTDDLAISKLIKPCYVDVARITLPLKSANSSSSTVKKKDDCVEVTEKITKGNVEMPVLIPHMCYVCMIPFLKKVSLKKHLVEHTNSIPYTCNDCHTEEYPMVFTTPFTMNRHLQSHNYPHQCSNCPKRFINQRVLEVHEQSHTNANESTTMVKVKVECNDHPQQLESRSTHNSQVDLSPSSCKHCKKTFKTAQFLARHKCHSPDDMPHVCKHCNRRFNNKNIFIAHMQMHTPEEESKSSLPSSSSPTSSSSSPSASATSPSMTKKTSIARVTVISKKKKRYDCYQPGCEYNTMVYSRMFFHHRMHLKAFACDQCPKRFPLASLLAKHKAKQHMHKEKPTKRKKCNIEEEI